jgi:hypothetical protein
MEDLLVSTCLTRGGQHAPARVHRALRLTPYAAETIVEAALGAGADAHLEVTVPGNVGEAGLRQLEQRFARLARRGVRVSIFRDPGWGGDCPAVPLT